MKEAKLVLRAVSRFGSPAGTTLGSSEDTKDHSVTLLRQTFYNFASPTEQSQGFHQLYLHCAIPCSEIHHDVTPQALFLAGIHSPLPSPSKTQLIL